MFTLFRRRRPRKPKQAASHETQTGTIDSPSNYDLPSRVSHAERFSSGRLQSSGTVPPYRESSSEDLKGTLAAKRRIESVPSATPRIQDRANDPLGITVLYAPESRPRTVDIVFIHGLGGSSLCTWAKNRDLKLLWPAKWLPEEPEFSTARILTFGYHANFSARKQQTSLNITDFANDFLFKMKYCADGGDQLGQVPIVIVAHSMGGLVFKKAFIQGHHNEDYGEITSNIKAVLFLATPHRGTDLAVTLNRVLSTSFLGHSPKEYVDELSSNSPTINELNDSFRHHASKLLIFSFYETMTTAVGPFNMMILTKDSSLLGYGNETRQPLVANHHDACKFSSREDTNYKSVRGALRSIVNNFRYSKHQDDAVEMKRDMKTLQTWLGVAGPPEDDMAALQSIRKVGTCEEILEKPEFEAWFQSQNPHILCAYAPPGSGKSILSSFVVDYLRELPRKCVYWFFKYDDDQKRSLSNMLRSVAYQIASGDANFRRALAELAKSGIQIRSADPFAIWRVVFSSKLSTLQTDLFWIVDGIDESDSSKAFFDIISNVGKFQGHHIRVLAFGRPLSSIIQAVHKAKKRTNITEIALTDNSKDISLVVADELEYFLSDEGFKQEIISEVTTRSQGNFLWASLVLKKLVQCHRKQDMKKVLETTPDGMDQLYQRMAEKLARLDQEDDKHLCKIFMSWAVYSKRPIGIEELKDAYSADLKSMFNLEYTITKVCAEFVVISAKNQIVLVHQTAREYLTASTVLPFSLDSGEVNEELLIRCINSLCDQQLRRKVRQQKTLHFELYASISWAFHLECCAAESDMVLEPLVRFFNGNNPLPWIQYLAMSNQLSELITVSSSLADFISLRKRADNAKASPDSSLQELSLLETWALDLLKMTARYGSHLADKPDIIYKYIPALSPTSSMLHQKYSNGPSALISVSGLSNTEWGDCLARVSLGSDRALHIAVSPQYLAIADGSPQGKIQLWNNILFQKYVTFDPGESICCIAFSQSGSLLACYGLDNTYVWRVSDGAVVATVKSPYRERAKAMDFGPHESYLIIATDLCRVYRLNLDRENVGWNTSPSSLLDETLLSDDNFVNSPSSLAFNADCTQLAVAYRNFPMTIWSIDPPEMLSRCKRKQKQGKTTNLSWIGVYRVVWHPLNCQVLGIYCDGNIFKWDPMDDSHDEVKQELDGTPSEIQCSRTGAVFATSDVKGTIKIYDFAQMVLIYKLTSNDMVVAIAFSLDSRRLYDLRGTYCNIWEPNSLTRLVNTKSDFADDNEGAIIPEHERNSRINYGKEDSRSSTTSNSAPEAHADTNPAITAIAICANNPKIFAFANEEGTIEIYDIAREQRHVIARSTFRIGIKYLSLSCCGSLVAYSAFNGRITVQSIDVLSKPSKAVSQVLLAEKTRSNRGEVRQILFSPDSDRIFIYSAERLQILDISSGTIIVDEGFQKIERVATWDNHPKDREILLAFTTTDVKAFSWDLFEPRYSFSLNFKLNINELVSTGSPTMESILKSSSLKIHLAIVSSGLPISRVNHVFLFDTSVLYGSNFSSSETIQHIPIPHDLVKSIDQPIGFLADGVLVFLDKDLWVCTVRLRAQPEARFEAPLKRHFFIPCEWLSSSGLALCRLKADGTLLCPSKGEVAIIKSDLGTETAGD